MNKSIKRKAITGLLTLSLATGFVQPGTSSAASNKLNKTRLVLTQGKQYTLKLKKTTGKITWKSSNQKVAVVSQKGKVTAKQAGKTRITAKTKTKKYVCRVTVKSKKPAATQKPVSTQTPVSTQKPVSTQAPAATRNPIIIQTPVSTQTPVNTKIPVTTQSPANTQKPVVTQKPVTTQTPVSTMAPSASNITEESAYNTLNSLRSTYPEGMTLTNSYYYYSPQFGNGYGCYGFAAKLSDTVFGTAKPYKTHTSFHQIKVGDNIRIGNYHSVIVLTKNADSITVVEGNYNSSVHWDRKITSSSLASSGFTVYTRY